MDTRIALIASISRLYDLHQTQHERGTSVIQIPTPKPPQPSAGFHLSLGLCLIDNLHRFEMEFGPGFHPKSKISDLVKIAISTATEPDIDYCIAFLCVNREIHYLLNDSTDERSTLTADTALIEKAGNFNQIRLTEAARLLMRAKSASDQWLYEDKDVEKVVIAVERGHFHDVERFCREIISSLVGFGLRITQIEERPTMDHKRKEYASFHTYYLETLSKAQKAIAKALRLSATQAVRDKFSEWSSQQSGVDQTDFGIILTHLERVAKTIEAVNRKLLKFVENLEGASLAVAGTIKFQEIAHRLVIEPLEQKTLWAITNSFLPTPMKNAFYYPNDFVGCIEFGVQSPEPGAGIFNIKSTDIPSRQRFNEFIERNRQAIIDLLKQGPVSFSTLIDRLGFDILPGESYANFLGIYSVSGYDDELKIKVGLDNDIAHRRIQELMIYGSDPKLSLCEGTI